MAENTKPTNPDGYADHLSGDWNDVPEWAIKRINFLEEVIETREQARCPRGANNCPDVPEMSCSAVKHCYPHLCDGTCGKSRDLALSDREFEMIRNYRGVGETKNDNTLRDREMRISELETRMDNAATMNVQNARNIAEQRERIDNLMLNITNDMHNNECTIDELRRKHNALTEEMVRVKTRMNAVEAIPEKDFRRDYCHDERLTLVESKAEGTAKELQTQINNLPRRVRAIVKESLKD